MSDLVKNKLKLYIFGMDFMINQLKTDFSKEMWVLILKGLKHLNIVLTV